MISKLAEWGFGVNSSDDLSIVGSYLVSSQQNHLFKTGAPTIEWYSGFRHHNPESSLRKAQNMPSDRAKASDKGIVDFFEKVQKVYDKHDLWDRPDCIFNTDESGYQCNQFSVLVMLPVNIYHLYLSSKGKMLRSKRSPIYNKSFRVDGVTQFYFLVKKSFYCALRKDCRIECSFSRRALRTYFS